MDRGWVFLVSGLLGGCFNPDPLAETGPDTDGSTGTDASTATATAPSSSDSISATGSGPTMSGGTDEPTTQGQTDSSGAVCGDGEVEGNETCDDGVNDGSYGGCLEDCTDFAEFCGDGEQNGPEVCDDGVNDDGYDGCASDCSALGPFCGDDEVQSPEDCDNGDANENASGCNIDCVTSGSTVATYEMTGLSYCDGVFVTKPAFRESGNVLVGVTGYCDMDSVVLAEFTSEAELEADYGETLLFPTTPMREGALVGDDWLLSNYACNYAISSTGELTEVCEDRVTGELALFATGDTSYVAADFSELASFGDGSPALGVAPDWLVAPPDTPIFDYAHNHAVQGPLGSTIVVGYQRVITPNTYTGYIAQYTSAGNLADSATTSVVERLYEAAVAPDDTVVAWSGGPEYELVNFSAGLNVLWQRPLNTDSFDLALDIDGAGDIVVVYRDLTSGEYTISKITPDGASMRWSNPVNTGSTHRIAIDDTDHIWLGSVGFGDGFEFTMQKIAP